MTEFHIDLELGDFAEEITVISETPVVDSEQVSTSQTFTYEHLQESSVGSINRRYYNVLAQAPGVASTRSRRRTDGTIAPVSYPDTNFNTDGEHFDKDEDIFEYSEPSFTLGGPVRRDRLWFFTGLSRIRSKSTPTGSPTARDLDRENVLGKLTWQASERWQLMGRHVGDRPKLLNANASPFTSAEATSRVDGETKILSADLLGLSASRLEWRLTLSRSRSQSHTLPMSGDLDTSGHIDIGLGYAATVNASGVLRSERDRDEVSASVAWFSGHDTDDHELRLGVDHGDIGYVRQSNLTGGGLYYDFGRRPYLWLVQPVYPPTPSAGALMTVYLQDTWRPNHDLTVKLGLRRDAVAFDNDVGAEIASLAKLQPRLGVAWVHGHVSLPAEVILGFGATWSSPFVYTPWHWGEPYGRVFDAPRGSLEANENHLLDLQVSRAFRFGRDRDAAHDDHDDDHDHGHIHHREHGHGLRFRLMASVYNLLDDEQVENVCAMSSGCFEGSGVGEPILYRQPWRFEVGVRLEF